MLPYIQLWESSFCICSSHFGWFCSVWYSQFYLCRLIAWFWFCFSFCQVVFHNVCVIECLWWVLYSCICSWTLACCFQIGLFWIMLSPWECRGLFIIEIWGSWVDAQKCNCWTTWKPILSFMKSIHIDFLLKLIWLNKMNALPRIFHPAQNLMEVRKKDSQLHG